MKLNQNFITYILFFSFLTLLSTTNCQSLAPEMSIANGKLTYGDSKVDGLYDLDNVHKIELEFSEPDWFSIMDGGRGAAGGDDGLPLVGVLTFNDSEIYDSVLVTIKGQTSDFRNDSEKKSFSIKLDEFISQDLMGYDNLNLNGGYQDPSSMREVLYYDTSRKFTTSLKGAFVELYINSEYWGPYSNIQQIEGTYISEWFIDNDGSRWRCIGPDDTTGGGGPGGGGGPRFGVGRSTLNYNGPDSTDYNEDYTLKNTDVEEPWAALINACEKLETTAIADLYDSLNHVIDLDKTLWFLAQEMVFMDDDSYIFKGGMDYYAYWHEATDRLLPMEVDGNTVMPDRSFDWDPFMNANNTDYVLMNKLFQNNELRQRYLAHIRTVLETAFVPEEMHNRIDVFKDILELRIENDTKKIFSSAEFLQGVDDLKDFITNRHAFLSDHQELDRSAAKVNALTYLSDRGEQMAPTASSPVQVRAILDSTIGIPTASARLYYSTGLEGAFDHVEMTLNGDELIGMIPAFPASTYVRFYTETISNDVNATASYFPVKAEQDVFIYQVVRESLLADDLVINEFMASNETTMQDEEGEYDDWIELYNNTNTDINLEGYHLSDNETNLTKWALPAMTIAPDEYLIIWADEDQEQGELHCNFKLSKGGESIHLTDPDGIIINEVFFDEQMEDLSYSRIPNATGDFVIQEATFQLNNETMVSTSDQEVIPFTVFPNPVIDDLYVRNSDPSLQLLTIIDFTGRTLISKNISGLEKIDVSSLVSGIYHVRIGAESRAFIVQK